MLNVSLVLIIAYNALFILGCSQNRLLLKLLYPSVPEDLNDHLSVIPVIIVSGCMLIIAAWIIVFNILLRRNPSRGMRIGAALFALFAYVADSTIRKFAVSIAISIVQYKAEEVSSVLMQGELIDFLYFVLSVLYITSLTLLVCAACVMQKGAEDG